MSKVCGSSFFFLPSMIKIYLFIYFLDVAKVIFTLYKIIGVCLQIFDSVILDPPPPPPPLRAPGQNER